MLNYIVSHFTLGCDYQNRGHPVDQLTSWPVDQLDNKKITIHSSGLSIMIFSATNRNNQHGSKSANFNLYKVTFWEFAFLEKFVINT